MLPCRLYLKTALLAGLVIASLFLVAACSQGPGSGSATDAERLVGTWVVDEYLITYASETLGALPTIDVAQLSNITASVSNGRWSTVCSPPCLGILRRSENTYTLDASRKRITVRTTKVDYIPAFDHLEIQAVGSEFLYHYSFPSENNLRLEGTGVAYVESERQFVAANVVVTATRR